MANDSIAESYDTQPYHSKCFPRSNPDYLYFLGTLHNRKPPVVETARVLEIGCASGGNIIPLAFMYPKMQIVGIDISGVQIREAIKTVTDLGLTNITFQQRSVEDLNEEDGLFDYIICHGVYSWVPGTVRESILETIQHRMASNGIGFVSYNTKPGWSYLGEVRKLFKFHSERSSDKITRADALKLLNLLKNSPSEIVRGIAETEHKKIMENPDAYFAHEYMELFNEAFYFKDFVRELGKHELAHLCDWDLSESNQFLYGQAWTYLQSIRNFTEREQYADHLVGRGFRGSVIVKTDGPEIVDHRVNLTAIPQMIIFANLEPFPTQVEYGSAQLEVTSGSPTFNVKSIPTVATVLSLISFYKKYVSFAELRDHIVSKLAERGLHLAETELERQLCASLLTFMRMGRIGFCLHKPVYSSIITEKPKLSAYERYQATELKQNWITTLNRSIVNITPAVTPVIGWIDGSRTVTELIALLADHKFNGDKTKATPAISNILTNLLRSHALELTES